MPSQNPQATPPAPLTEADGTPVFVIGLTMAGAISAGAYTAGVVDYLFRALQAHNARVERRKSPAGQAADPDGPAHKVMIKVISGASAGGMTAGLTLGALMAVGAPDEADWDQPTAFDYDGVEGPAQGDYVLTAVYRAWVEDVTLWDGAAPGRKAHKGLLALEDLEAERRSLDGAALPTMAERPVTALLNGLHLDQVASDALKAIPAWGSARPPFDFLAEDLEIFLTTTALNGLVYDIQFAGADAQSGFSMEQHGITRHFRLSGMGCHALGSPWLEAWQDAGIALDLHSSDPAGQVPFTDPADPGRWHSLTVAALSTGAFPLGLMPRYVAAKAVELGALQSDADGRQSAQGGALPIPFDPTQTQIKRPSFDGLDGPEAPAPYIAVDGGAINNEPFELARYTLREGDGPGGLRSNPRGASEADRAVIMIDPFPEGARYEPLSLDAAEALTALPRVFARLLPSLMTQARFKPSELLAARDPETHSRFMISPVRRDGLGGRYSGAAAIASGALGGFGGFFDHAFRNHDFLLGQHNCRKFLSDHFTLAPDNPVLGLDQEAQKRAAGGKCPILDPDPLPVAADAPFVRWPRISQGDLARIRAQGKTRLSAVVNCLIEDLDLSNVHRLAAYLGWRIFRHSVVDRLSRLVLADLVSRDQVATYAEAQPAARAILALLLGSGDRPITAKDLHGRIAAAMAARKLPDGFALPNHAALEAQLEAWVGTGWVERPWWNIWGPRRYRAPLAPKAG